MRIRTTLTPTAWLTLLGLCVILTAGCGNSDPEDPGSGTSPTANQPRQEQADANAAVTPIVPRDREPPIFDSPLEARNDGWGQIVLDWEHARDNVSGVGDLRYHLEAYDPMDALAPGLQAGSADVEEVEGETEWRDTVAPGQSVWVLYATDAAGNMARTQPVTVEVTPTVRQLGTNAVRGSLTSCRRVTAERLVCVGENGRLAEWDGETWIETLAPMFGNLELVATTERGLELVSSYQRVRWDESNQNYTLIPDVFEGDSRPVLFRTFTEEPTGLLIRVDTTGRPWLSSGSTFLPVDDLLMLGPQGDCARLFDLTFGETRAFARCASGQQYLLRMTPEVFEWFPLDDSRSLTASASPFRRLLFGEGRELTALTSEGVVWRYDLGGWRLFAAQDGEQPPRSASLLREGADPRFVAVAIDDTIYEIDILGGTEVLRQVDSRFPVIYEEPDGLVVTAQGELFDAREAPLRTLPPSDFVDVIGSRDGLFALVANVPERLLFRRVPGMGFVQEEISEPPVSFLAYSVFAATETEVYYAGDVGEDGGQIRLLDGDRFETMTFLYPAPPEPEPDPDPDNPPDPDAPETDDPMPDPATVHLGVHGSELPEPPPPPPPVRAVYVDPETNSGIAVGEGGSAWLLIEAGWLAFETGLAVPTPLIAAAVIGDHHFLIGGIGNVLLECVWSECLAAPVTLGDVLRFQPMGEGWLALGSSGMAYRTIEGIWEPLDLRFAPPYPRGGAPESVVEAAIDEDGAIAWALGDDGTLWQQIDGQLRSMAVFEDPLALWLGSTGNGIVATPDAIYQVAPLPPAE